MMNVMIAVDGTALDREVASVAHRLFGEAARYWAVNVQDVRAPVATPVPVTGALIGYGASYPYISPDPYRIDESEAADPQQSPPETAAAAVVDDAGIPDAEVVAEVGPAPDAILRAAHDHHADVIVVGNHERGWWSKLLVSSVTDDVLDSSTIPVLVVKQNADDEAADVAR